MRASIGIGLLTLAVALLAGPPRGLAVAEHCEDAMQQLGEARQFGRSLRAVVAGLNNPGALKRQSERNELARVEHHIRQLTMAQGRFRLAMRDACRDSLGWDSLSDGYCRYVLATARETEHRMSQLQKAMARLTDAVLLSAEVDGREPPTLILAMDDALKEAVGDAGNQTKSIELVCR